MKSSISRNEHLILKLFIVLTALLTAVGIASKYIGGYNRAIEENFLKLAIDANKSMSFGISDCYKIFPHELFFTFFLLFTFLFVISARKFTEIGFLLPTIFATLTLTVLQGTYLSLWFADTVNIEWNSNLIQPNVFDGVLYFCFTIILFIELKITYRFAKEKFQVKIFLK